MSAEIIDGRAYARALTETTAVQVEWLLARRTGLGLATMMVGDDYAAMAYERRLRMLADALSIPFRGHSPPAEVPQEDLLEIIGALNADAAVLGILVLRPLPRRIDESAIFREIDPRKDIESVHPENAGLLALGVPRCVPSTAAAVFHLLDTWIDTIGDDRADSCHRSRIVVVGRSNNVGKPLVPLVYLRGAFIELIDEWADRTTGLGRHTRWADVLTVAAGKAGLVKAEHVSRGAVIIDVGINPSTGRDGRARVVSDVCFDRVAPRARAITPVPSGVGPVTDVWLMHNTIAAALARAGPAIVSPSDFTLDSITPLLEVS